MLSGPRDPRVKGEGLSNPFMAGSSDSAFLSPLTGNSDGITNNLYHGRYFTFISSTSMSAGFSDDTGGGVMRVAPCNGNIGEQNASSMAVGVTLYDCVVGGQVRVAVSGICSVLVGVSTTGQRGCMVTVGGSASSWQGRVVCTSRTANEPSIGVCMSYGSRTTNQPIVVWIQGGFESY